SKATSELVTGCESWKGPRRIVTTLDAGRTCRAPTLKAGVSCTEATSQEKVSSTVVCVVPGGGCGFATGGAGALVIGTSGVWVVSDIVAGVAIFDGDDTGSGTYERTSWTASAVEGSIPLARTSGIACSCASGSAIAAATGSIAGVAATSATTGNALGSSVGGGT